MSSVPVLYHAESSFFSQRARLAFAEKGVAYRSRLISLVTGESHEPWYIRTVSAKGTVPALEHRGRFFTDSKDIIEYVDTLPSDKPNLCPEGESHYAMRVRYFRDELNALNIPIISYGAAYHRDAITTGCMMPGFMTKKRIEAMLTAEAEKMSKLAAAENLANPGSGNQLRDIAAFRDSVKDEGLVLASIDDCDRLLGEVEEELRKRKSEHGDDEYWLCGKTFTIADIFLSCLLHRLTFAGLSERLFLSKRPLTTDYYQRVLKRRSFQKECAYANSVFWSIFLPIVRAGVKRALPVIFFVCFAVAGAYAYYRREYIHTVIIDLVENGSVKSTKDTLFQSGAESEL